MAKNSISTAIITFNEERCIRQAIESALTVSTEVVILDSGSTDSTLDIARSYKRVRIYSRSFDNYAAQRNEAIDRCQSQWILMLDADEELSTDLQHELRSIQLESRTVYTIRRHNWFWGRQIKHAIGPDFQDRLFENSSTNRYVGDVHENLQSDYVRHLISGPLLHKPAGDSSSIFGKQNKYTDLEISKGHVLTKSTTLLCLKPLLRFFQILVVRRGFLDGWRGLAWAYVAAAYDIQVAVKTLEHRGKCR